MICERLVCIFTGHCQGLCPGTGGYMFSSNDPQDCTWLREVHLPADAPEFRCFVLVGNEDCPNRVDLYEAADPEVTDAFVSYVANEEGELRRSPVQLEVL